MWSSITIPGRPSLLAVDATCNRENWEYDFMDRLFNSLKRSGLPLATETAVRIAETSELTPHLSDSFNCILFFGHGEGTTMQNHWEWLNLHANLSPKLFAALMCQRFDPEMSRRILESPQVFAPLAVAPLSPLTPREAGLFLLKFFTELSLHSSDALSGKMVWFSASKARELLKKRRYGGKFGVRC